MRRLYQHKLHIQWQPEFDADVVIDGVTTSNFEQNSGIMSATYTPSVEAVEEFKVQQLNFSAEFGFFSGASVVSMSSHVLDPTHSTAVCMSFSATTSWMRTITAIAGRLGHHPPQSGFTIGGPIKKNKKTFSSSTTIGLRQQIAFLPEPQAYQPNLKEPVTSASCAHFGGGSFDGSGLCSEAAGQISGPI